MLIASLAVLAVVLVFAGLRPQEWTEAAAPAAVLIGIGALGLHDAFVASVTTAVLSLDATVVLLTPVVLATARTLRLRRGPHTYASAHLPTPPRCCCRGRT